MIQNVDPEVIAAGVTFIITLVDAARRYHRDEEVKLHQLPWLEFRALFEFGRKRFATVGRPDHPGFETDLTIREIKETLGMQGVQWGHRISYRYAGEVLNGYAYYYDPSRNSPHRMIHVRVFDLGDYRLILAHEEPFWYAHPVEHIKSRDMEFENAVEWTKQRLENVIPVGYPGN